MNKKIYVVRDVLVGYACISGAEVLILLNNDEVALRVVRGSLAEGAQANALNVNPEDKELWCVGEFNQDTGKIVPSEPRLVAKAIDYLQKGKVVPDGAKVN